MESEKVASEISEAARIGSRPRYAWGKRGVAGPPATVIARVRSFRNVWIAVGISPPPAQVGAKGRA